VENILSFKLALQTYTKSLLRLLRLCTGLTYREAAKRCGITQPQLSHWVSGFRPMPPHHEKALRRLLTQGIHDMRASIAAMRPEVVDTLQYKLIQALAELELAVHAMEKEYTASIRRQAASIKRAREALPAATPAVHDIADDAARAAYATQAALPGLWRAIADRNRRLRARLSPEATADPRSNIHALLDYAEDVYGLREGEAIEEKGPRHRGRGRPRKPVEHEEALP
jgi:transcriptional regulator with XRE-family HTH domain